MLKVTGQRDFEGFSYPHRHPGDDLFHLLDGFDGESDKEVVIANTLSVRINSDKTQVEVVDLIDGVSEFVTDLKGRVLLTMRYHEDQTTYPNLPVYVHITDEHGSRFTIEWVDSKSQHPIP